MTRGDSDEDWVEFDSPGSEVEFEELIAEEEAAPVSNSQMSQTFEQQCCEQHTGRWMTWTRATSFDGDEKCAQILARPLQVALKEIIEGEKESADGSSSSRCQECYCPALLGSKHRAVQ